MNCPRCNGPLQTRSGGGLTAAICDNPKCGGGWMSATDLEQAIRRFANAKGVELKSVALLEGPSRATTQRCPECTTPLNAVTLRGVQVERCPACQGVFLDVGEGRQIAQRTIGAAGDWQRSYDALMRTIRDWSNPPSDPLGTL